MRLYHQLAFCLLILSFHQTGNAQDTPCSAISLSSNMADFEPYSTLGLSNSGIDQPVCGNTITADIWFEVIVPPSGYLNIVTLAATMTNGAMAIYTGNCNTPTEIACTDDDNCGNSIMPILALYNQVPGGTIFIRIWAETGGNGSFDIQITDAPVTAPPLNLTTVGSATSTSASCVQLTSSSAGQTGCAWDATPFDFSVPFQYNIALNFGNIDGNGADGICLAFQNDPAGLAACGNTGGSIAVAGIQNSFIIEFDTWDNGAGVNDIGQDHVAVSVNGDIANPINGPTSLGNIEDGQDHEILFTWNPASNFYEIEFDGAVVMSGNYDIINNCFGGMSTAFGGFTASTGGSVNTQTVCTVEPANYPSGNEALVEVEICEGDNYFVGGSFQTTNGIYQDIYAAFNGCDSIIRTNLIVNPTSSSILNETICADDCFFYNGQPFCGPGQYEVTFTNALNCDSIVTLNLTVIDPVVDIIQPDILTCTTSSVVLDGSNSASGIEVTYLWEADDANCLDGDINLPVITASCAGTYTLWVFQTVDNMVCSSSEEIEVVELQIYPTTLIAVPDELSCSLPCTTIDASASNGGGAFMLTWTGPDNFMSNEQNPEVCTPGIYQLIITNTQFGCADTASVEVFLDGNNPLADAGNDVVLTCINDEAILDGSNSSQSNDFVLAWTAENGMVLSDMPMLTVSEEGLYILSISSITNGCISQDTVLVTSNYDAPIAISSPNSTLDCINTMTLLDGTASNSPEDFSFLWQNSAGMNLSTDTTFTIQNPDTYTLVITNINNGCADTTTTEIVQNILPPTADAGMNQSIDCNNASVDLSGMGSNGVGNLSFLWLDNAGMEISTDTIITVNMEGVYDLIVTNIGNGCTDTSTVNVVNNVIFPVANAGEDTLINCLHPEIILSSAGSTMGTNIIVEWQNSGQNIGNSSNITIENAGMYTLLITNTDNGCASSGEVLVDENFIAPTAIAGDDEVLNCSDVSILLDGGLSDMGNNFAYEWQDNSGNPIGQNITQEINAADTYTFIVTDETNGCQDSSSLVVSLEINAPIADAGMDIELNCNLNTAELDGSASSNGANITYEWIDENDMLLGTNAMLSVSTTGTYSLEVLNTDNGCTSISNAVVSIDTLIPPLPNLPDLILNCNNRQHLLGQLLLNNHPDWNFSWQNSNGDNLAFVDTVSVELADVYTLNVFNTTNFCASSTTVSVTEDFTLPTIALLTPDTLTCTTPNVFLNAGSSDTGNNFSLLWQNSLGEIIAENTSNVSINQAETYTLQIQSLLNGCISIDSVQVEIDTLYPLAIINPIEDITCTNPELTLDGSASSTGNNFTLTWENEIGDILGSTNQLLVNMPGNYLLTVENSQNNCISEFSIAVNQNIIAPVANAGIDVILDCYSPTNILTGQNEGSNTTIIYEWLDGNGNTVGEEPTLAIETLANYTLLLIDTINGCMHQDEVQVFENFQTPVSDAGAATLLDCITTNTNLGAGNTSVGANFDYEWQNISGNEIGNDITFSTALAGSYTFIVLDTENGCLDTSEVVVTVDQLLPNVILAVAETLTCVQLTAVLDGTASDMGTVFDYNWTTITGGNILNGVTELSPFVALPGTYELLLTNTENGCTNSQQVAVNQNITPPVANAGINFELDCHSPISSLDASASAPVGNLVFLWSTTGGQFESNVNEINTSISLPGDYELLVTALTNGCTAIDEVSVSSNFITTMDFETTQPLCYGDEGELVITAINGGQTPFLYSIDGGVNYGQNNQFVNLPAGEYPLMVQDANGCEIENISILYAPNEVLISLESQAEILLGESYQLNAQTNIPETQIASISWTPAEVLSCDTCLNPIATPYLSTTFIVTVVDTNNCSAQAITEIFVDKTPPIYIPNVFSPNGDGTNDVFMIFGDARSIKHIKSFQIFNRWGESVFEVYNFLPNNPFNGWDGNHYSGKPYNSAVFVYFTEIEFIDGRTELFKGDVTLVR